MSRIYTKKSYRTKSKYGNKTKIYNGKCYDSIREANHAEELDWRIKAGEIKDVIPQFRIPIVVNNIRICNYFVDFRVIMKDGTIQYHEVKGFETEVWRLKWKLFEALIDEIDKGAELLVIK